MERSLPGPRQDLGMAASVDTAFLDAKVRRRQDLGIGALAEHIRRGRPWLSGIGALVATKAALRRSPREFDVLSWS